MLDLLIILTCYYGTIEAEVQVPSFPDIPVIIEETWQITYASDMQDIAIDFWDNTLVIRSNADGKLYLANAYNCEYQGEIELPAGSDGFGVAVMNEHYYINSSTSPMIFHSDGSDSWSEFPNPALTSGSGMDFNEYASYRLSQITAFNPNQLYSIEPDGSSFDMYGLPGVSDEISGFMGHVCFTMDYPPDNLILTTRFGHEFFFYEKSGSTYMQYGRESCPVPVSESLGLAWSTDFYVYWGYKGLDDEYYISKLFIDVFGGPGIGDDPYAETSQTGHLRTTANPSQSSVFLSVNITDLEYVLLEVFDMSGRLVEVLNNGQLNSGETSFNFSGPPGIYTAYLKYSGQEETFRFVLISN